MNDEGEWNRTGNTVLLTGDDGGMSSAILSGKILTFTTKVQREGDPLTVILRYEKQ